LASVETEVENNWTSFLVSTLTLNHMAGNGAWDDEKNKYAGKYFGTFNGDKVAPYRNDLMEKSKASYVKTVNDLASQQKYSEAVALTQDLPKPIASFANDGAVAWSLAESYRRLGQPNEAQGHYKTAMAERMKGGTKVDQFRAAFWYAVTANETLELKKLGSTEGGSINKMKRNIKTADESLADLWHELEPKDKQLVMTELRDDLEGTLKLKYSLKTPPKMMLEAWSSSLAGDGGENKTTPVYAPEPATIGTLSRLADRFSTLGMKQERDKSLQLMAKLKPSDLGNDSNLKNLWSKDLRERAEEYRKAGNYSEAAKIYAVLSDEDSENRAELLYKAGLLYFKGGKRNEALQALEKASQDGNNLLYADLAKKRLAQLQE
jgi:tetratricopeptide (TPR) repeat protein